MTAYLLDIGTQLGGVAAADLPHHVDAPARTIRASSADAEDYERAASLRDQKRDLLAEQESHHQEWAATHPDPPALADKVRQLSEEIDRLRDLLRQHGAEPEDGTA